MRDKTPTHFVTYNKVSFRAYHVDAGEGLSKHTHEFSHLTMCHAGSIVVRKEGRELVMTRDTLPVNLVANEWHEIEALEDGTVFVNVVAEGEY